MAFGALPMKSDGVDLKIHEIRNPHQIMMSQVFNFTASASTHGSSGEVRVKIESSFGWPESKRLSDNSLTILYSMS